MHDRKIVTSQKTVNLAVVMMLQLISTTVPIDPCFAKNCGDSAKCKQLPDDQTICSK